METRIIRKILGPRKTSEDWTLRSNDEIYQIIENIPETMRKRRLLFFGHLCRMNDNRLTKQIFKCLWGKKSTSSWIKELQKDLEKNNIHTEQAIEREIFRTIVLEMEGVRVGEMCIRDRT